MRASRSVDAGYEAVAYTAGKMKKNRIKTLVGDRVTSEMSSYDLQKGRLIFRCSSRHTSDRDLLRIDYLSRHENDCMAASSITRSSSFDGSCACTRR